MKYFGWAVTAILIGCGTTPDAPTHTTSGHADLSVLNPAGSVDLAQQAQVPDDSGTMEPADMGCEGPSSLHPPKANMPAIYCPFSGVNGGKPVYCQQGTQHCCEPSMGAAACSPLATPCGATDTDWQCEDTTDCAKGQFCCGIGTLVMPGGGCRNYGSKFNGTHCAAKCAAAEIVMCTSDGECSNGQTCVPFETKANQVGGCN